ncbi:MAG TPA: SDR family oxidoreductase [Armatimonadota bacterium]|jgi:NAD(P)-dependent dehydrogenase (short-subunit alcohol dehydrogenase family)
MSMFDLSGKTAVVTGGGGILCKSMAVELGRCGAKVAVLDLRKEAADAAAQEIKSNGGQAIGVECNVLKRDSLESACAEILAAFGTIDILINGAGGNSPKATTSKDRLFPEDLKEAVEGVKTFFDLDPDGVSFVFNLNFLGTLLPTQVFGRVIAENGGGVILNVSSMNAFRPLTKIPAYSGAKAAISNFTQWLATHFAPCNIRVNAIAPGFFLTDQNRFLLTDEQTGDLTERGNTIIAHTPQGRFGTPEDLNGTMVWLLSEASKFVTGVVVPVDGGFSAFSGV